MNEAKPSLVPLPCKQCQQPDGQAHMILYCPHPNMMEVREEIIQDLHNTVLEIIDKTEPYLGAAAIIFERFILDSPEDMDGITSTNWDPERIWRGTWSDAQGAYFTQLLEEESTFRRSSITHKKVRHVRNTIILLSTILADGIRKLFAIRTQLNKVTRKTKTLTIQPMKYKHPKKRKKTKQPAPENPHIPPQDLIPHHRAQIQEFLLLELNGISNYKEQKEIQQPTRQHTITQFMPSKQRPPMKKRQRKNTQKRKRQVHTDTHTNESEDQRKSYRTYTTLYWK
jgi:hypothetical protein